MSRLERILAVVLAALAVILVSGTAYGVITGSRARKLALAEAPREDGSGFFDGLGRVRAETADDPPAIVVLEPVIPYDLGDRAFREELELKRPELKAAIEAFLSSKKGTELGPAYESAVKAALRDAINSILELGTVSELYFPVFQVID